MVIASDCLEATLMPARKLPEHATRRFGDAPICRSVDGVFAAPVRRRTPLGPRRRPKLPAEGAIRPPEARPPPSLRIRDDGFIEVLLFLRTPGGPFEGSSIDALAELAAKVT
jgi:hypothetical protein